MKAIRHRSAVLLLSLMPATALATGPATKTNDPDSLLIGERAKQWAHQHDMPYKLIETTLPNGKRVTRVAVAVTPDNWDDFKQTFANAGKEHQAAMRASLRKNGSAQAIAYMRGQPSGVIAVHMAKERTDFTGNWTGRWSMTVSDTNLPARFHFLTAQQIIGRRPEVVAPVQSRFITPAGERSAERAAMAARRTEHAQHGPFASAEAARAFVASRGGAVDHPIRDFRIGRSGAPNGATRP